MNVTTEDQPFLSQSKECQRSMAKNTTTKVHDYMVKYFIEHGHYPKQEDIANKVGISRGRVGQILSILATQGLIRFSKDYWKKANGTFGYDYREVALKHSEEIKDVLQKEHATERHIKKNN